MSWTALNRHLNRPFFSRSRGPNAQFGPSATPLFKILKKEWRPRQAAPDPPPGSPLSRILEGGACSGVVAPGLGEMGEREEWHNEVLEKGAGGVGWGSGEPRVQGALKKLERIISEPDQTRK